MVLKDQSNRSIASNSESGFSLITIAIALAIIGILMIPAMQMYTNTLRTEKEARNKTVTTMASSALNRYFLMFGRYPTPARPGDIRGSTLTGANFGHSAIEPSPGGWLPCNAAPLTEVCSTTVNTASGAAVLIGVLPFAEIGLPFSSITDSSSNLLTYAVTKSLTDAPPSGGHNESAGQIILIGDPLSPTAPNFQVHPAGTPRSHFVVVSHGADGKGAYNLNGLQNAPCSTDPDSDDFENCNRDGRFRSNLKVAGKTEIALYEGVGTLHFDDYVDERNSSASGIWAFLHQTSTTDLSVNDRVGGNVAIGNCDGRSPCIPVSRLDIYGDGISTYTPAVRADAIKTRRFCGRGNSSGDAPGTGSFDCISDYTQPLNTGGVSQSSCITNWSYWPYYFCPPITSLWSDTRMPPWFSPTLITGTPPVLLESGDYWMTAPNHGYFHRGNGILCVGKRALNGMFDRDEACNDTSYVSTTTRDQLNGPGGGCPTGYYARGITSAGKLLCESP